MQRRSETSFTYSVPPISTHCDISESMTALKNTGIRLVVLLLLQSLWLGTSHAQTPVSPTFGNEMSKQESIYQSTGDQVPKGYSIDRSLEDYTRGLTGEFGRALANLGQ